MNITKIIAGILVVLAIALGLLAWSLGMQAARKPAPEPAARPLASTAPAEDIQLHDLVVLARPLAAGQRIGPEDLKTIQVRTPPVGSFTTLEEALGRTSIVALDAHAPLLEQQLVTGLALHLEPGQRALSIAVNETLAAGHRVRPGDFVDVYFTLDGSNEHTPVDTQTRLLLARSRVLAYGGTSVDNPPPTAAQLQAQQAEQEAGSRRSGGTAREEQAQRPENARTAVLAVAQQDVERLTLAEKYGHLTLALRHPDDLSVPDPALFAALPVALRPASLQAGQPLQDSDRAFAGLKLDDLATGADARNRKRAAPPAPAAPAQPRLHAVEMHRGGSVQTVRY